MLSITLSLSRSKLTNLHVISISVTCCVVFLNYWRQAQQSRDTTVMSGVGWSEEIVQSVPYWCLPGVQDPVIQAHSVPD